MVKKFNEITVLNGQRQFHCKQKNRWYEVIVEDVETRFDTSNYELNKPLTKGKNKKLIGLMEDELLRKIMRKCVGLRRKTYSYLINDSNEDKKAKGTRKFAINIKHKFENYKKCLEATQPEDKINHLVKKIDIDSFYKKS